MADLNSWDITAANNNSAPPDGWPENTMQYSEVNDTAREGMAVIARYFADTNGSLAAGGAADVYTLTLNAGYSAYFTGMRFSCTVPADNTGASTIDVNGIGAVSVVGPSNTALLAGELVTGVIYDFVYNGTAFQALATDKAVDAIYYNTIKRFSAASDGAGLHSDADADGVNRLLRFLYADSTSRGFVGHTSVNDFIVRNEIHGAPVRLQGEDFAGGTLRNLFVGDPDDASLVYHKGIARFTTSDDGANVASDGSADSVNRLLNYIHQDGTVRGLVGHLTDDIFRVRNSITSGELRLEGKKSDGSTIALMARLLPDDAVVLYTNNVATFQTADYSVAGALTGATLADAGGTFRYVGRADMIHNNISASQNVGRDDAHETLRVTGSSPTLTFVNTSDLPVGAVGWIATDGSGCTLAPGSGVTLKWLDGAGGQTGTRTVANGSIVTWLKISNTSYTIFGNGIT